MLKNNIKVLVVTILILTGYGVSAQLDDQSSKSLKKIERYYKREKYEKAGNLMQELLNKYPLNENLWEYYQGVMYNNYVKNYIPVDDMYIEVKSKEDGVDTKEFTRQFNYLLKKPLYDYNNAVFYAATSTPYNAQSSILLRKKYIDPLYYDESLINIRSKAYYQRAEAEFNAKNYEKAISLYQQSYDEDTTNYKALLYLGDTYLSMGYYGKAAKYFRKARKKQPMLTEPIKFLADALAKKGDEKAALELVKQSLLIYPEESMYILLYKLTSEMGTKMDRNWVLRLAPTANIIDYYHRNQFYTDELHFSHYRDALAEVKDLYDVNGLLRGDKLLQASERQVRDKYLEVYCWRKMLKATVYEGIPALDYARYMESEGMLEPYLLIGLFNVDLYAQYRDLVKTNEVVIDKYINNYLIIETL
ncbi:MAG: tetratricopeptide (TPR) repeat protein [Bacteroidia bacterium]|jgi:tetratricopeptide (TPR) repeat protein